MKSQVCLAGALAIAISSGTVFAANADLDLKKQARAARKIVVAKATSVSPRWRTSASGDLLIVSLVGLEIEETLKGEPGTFAWLDVEGGSLNGVTLRVSSMPEIKPGERAVFFLDETPDGSHVPHMKGKGVWKLDQKNKVVGNGAELDDIKRQVRDAVQ